MNRHVLQGERRWHLRDATLAAHSRLDEAVGALHDMPGYARYLRAVHGFRAPLEAAVSEGLGALPPQFHGWRPCLSTQAMETDMRDLGLFPLPGPDPVRHGDPAELIGMLYVLEGASLGSRLLFRRAQDLGLNAEFGARHLALQSRNHAGWGQFLMLLEGLETLDMDLAAKAANSSFLSANAMFAAA